MSAQPRPKDQRPACLHTFRDSNNCARCRVHVDVLRAEDEEERAELARQALTEGLEGGGR